MMHLARRILIGSLVVGGSFVVTQSAEAGFIDFGSAAWAPNGAKQSVSVGGITVTATAPKGSDLSWTSGLGFGVDSSLVDELLGTGDEINSVEILSVTMPTATTISGFTVSNLFTESLLGLLKYSEVGYYSINGGQWTQFVAPDSNTQSNERPSVGVVRAVARLQHSLRLRWRRWRAERLLGEGDQRRVHAGAGFSAPDGHRAGGPRGARP